MSPDPIWGQLLLQFILIGVNAFFAASEMALVSVNENKLRYGSEQGDAKAAQMLKMLESPDGFLSTIQICITLAGYLGSAFAADNFADRIVRWVVDDLHFTALPANVINSISVILITLLLSYVTLVLGELVPKRVAMNNPEKMARITSGVVFRLSKVLTPVVRLLSASMSAVLKLLHSAPAADQGEVTEEEIRQMVDMGEEKGAIGTDEREMIENVFEFNNTLVSEIMTHRMDVQAIQVDDLPENIVALIKKTGLSRFPVYDDDLDDVLGTISTREYLLNERADRPKTMRQMLRDAYFVPETVRADALFRDMQKRKIHMAIVVDEYGGTSGIITLEDLLEEIVGNIYDEFDPLEQDVIQKVSNNLWRASGGVDLETVEDELHMKFPEELECDTVGGLVFGELTVIPQDGSHPEVDTCGLHIKVERLEDRRVASALISKIYPDVETVTDAENASDKSVSDKSDSKSAKKEVSADKGAPSPGSKKAEAKDKPETSNPIQAIRDRLHQ